jgi:hypothetical protein
MYTLIVVALVLVNNITLTMQTSPITQAACLTMQQEFVDQADATETLTGTRLQYAQCVPVQEA